MKLGDVEFTVVSGSAEIQQLAKCKHGIESGQCLSIECVKPNNIPIRGEKSWDSALQQPSVGSYLNQYQFQFQNNNPVRWIYQSFLSPSFLLRNETPKKSQPKPTERSMPVIGYRAWKVAAAELELQSLSSQFGTWNSTKPTVAKCGLHHSHTAPHYHCECGLYVLSNLRDAPRWLGGFTDYLSNFVVGAVVGWGNVIQHGNEGWRAEFARPIAFLQTDVFEEQPLLFRVAEQYGVPVMDRPGLQLYAAEYGSQLEEKSA